MFKKLIGKLIDSKSSSQHKRYSSSNRRSYKNTAVPLANAATSAIPHLI